MPASYGTDHGHTALGTFDLDYRRGGFYNWREAKWMLLLNVNLRDLILWNQQNGEPFFATTDNSDGGLVIFATIDGPEFDAHQQLRRARLRLRRHPAARRHRRLRRSDRRDRGDRPGDVRRSATSTAAPSTAATPRQPASLIGDSVNVLSSNYWRSGATGALRCNCCTTFCRDGQSALASPSAARNAQSTWINAAFLGGVDTTPAGSGAATTTAASRTIRASTRTGAARRSPTGARSSPSASPTHVERRLVRHRRHRQRLQHLQPAESQLELRRGASTTPPTCRR